MRKSTTLLLGVISALFALFLANPPTAVAASADAWGFAFLDNATPVNPYTPDPNHQWGSWKSGSCAAQWATVDHLVTGHYRVHFPCIANNTGIPHVTAVNNRGVWCQIATWGQAADRDALDVDVLCFLPQTGGPFGRPPSGTPTDTRFVVMFTRSSGAPTPLGGDYGYVHAADPANQYNTTGATNTVSYINPGEWVVTLPNLPQKISPSGGDIQVTAVNPTVGARCKVGFWAGTTTGGTYIVGHCYDAASNPLNTDFTLSYLRERDILGRISPRFGYILTDSSPPPDTNWQSSSGTNTCGGISCVFPTIGALPDHIQITALGYSDPDYCQPTNLWTTTTDATAPIACFDANAAPANSDFFATYVTRS